MEIIEYIIRCPVCKTLNRVKPHASARQPICGRCQTNLDTCLASCSQNNTRSILLIVVIVLCIVMVGYFAKEPMHQIKPSVPSTAPVSHISSTQSDQPITKQPYSLPNGTAINKIKHIGKGKLDIHNGLAQDASVKIINVAQGGQIANYYVSSKSRYVINGIPDGEYKLIFATGDDWNQEQRRFNRNRHYSIFVDVFDYSTTKTKIDGIGYIDYTVCKVTLHPVPDGGARTQNITEEEFNKF